MATQIFLGEPPANIKRWIEEHAAPATHADTWYKYADDTEWRTVSISGTISGSYDEDVEEFIPTTQIPNAENVVSLEIGTNVTSIGNFAFCGGVLTNVMIPGSVTSIGDNVFDSCGRLMSVTIPDSVTSIGEDLFFGCLNLTSVTIVANGGNAENVKQMLIAAGIPENITWNMPS